MQVFGIPKSATNGVPVQLPTNVLNRIIPAGVAGMDETHADCFPCVPATTVHGPSAEPVHPLLVVSKPIGDPVQLEDAK